MPKGYAHLTQEDRCQIYALKKSGMSHHAIARQLAVSSRTIDREINRNSGLHGYHFDQAHDLSQARRRKGPLKMKPALVAEIEKKITEQQLSPEQISGEMKATNSPVCVSHEVIYQHIEKDKKNGGSLHTHLRRGHKKYQKRVNGKTNRGRIIGRVDISQRPEIVETRSRIGDWEADTVIGLGHKSALVTLVERKTRLVKIAKVQANTAQEVSSAIIRLLKPYKKAAVHTITFDNGREFAYHLNIAKQLKAKTFFAKPYHSWERGANENTNGLIRQYFPKKTDFSTVTDEQVHKVETLLNNRPRKCLGFVPPNQAFLAAA